MSDKGVDYSEKRELVRSPHLSMKPAGNDIRTMSLRRPLPPSLSFLHSSSSRRSNASPILLRVSSSPGLPTVPVGRRDSY